MKLQRPLQNRELETLDGRLRRLDVLRKRHLGLLVVWTLLALGVGAFAWFRMEKRDEILLLYATVAVYIGIGVRVFGKEYLARLQEKRSICFLIDKNEVTAVVVNSDRYLHLEEQEDEGDHYLFQLPGNQVFSFGGQDFYSTERFPSDRFEIVVGCGSRNEILLLETYSYGKKTDPLRVIAGDDKWNMINRPGYPDPEKLTIVSGKLQDYTPGFV